MVNNINKNAISEILARKELNVLNKIKNAEIKNKRLIPKQKELLNLFDNLYDTILTENENHNTTNNTNTNTNNNTNNTNNKSNNNSNNNKNENENEDDNDDIVKQLNDCLDEIIDKSKSFEDQIKLLRTVENLQGYFVDDHDNKELAFKVFKLRLAHLTNIIDAELFAKIFGYTLEALANKLINRTNKEENQTIFNNINENKEKL